jgi:hypothetical protein
MEVWSLGPDGTIRQLSDEVVQALPQWIIDTLDDGMLAMYYRVLYGLSPEHLLGTA